jgi:outer membrane protein assembly factor BamB
VPAKLSTGWEARLGGKLSSVVVADGKLFVAAVDRHTVHAIDADTGRPVWQFVAGGRVDSPPTYYAGSVLFGSADGCVYRVRASDGTLAWRFRAAPADERAMTYGQIESLWPVHGSILVRDGIAYFVAGRSVFLDGGMRLCRLDARTGKIISQSVLDHRNPKTGKDLHELVQWLNMPVGRSDVLSSDGRRLYMRSQAFDLEGKRLAMGPTLRGPQEGTRQGGENTHLFCPAGFLDDTWFHRQYWLYAKTWGSGWNGYYIAGKHAPAGRIMSIGDDLVYAFGRQPQFYRWTTPMEFRLFAAKKVWKAGPARPQPAKKAAAKAGKKKRRPAAPGPVLNDANYAWQKSVPVLVRGMVLAGDTLFIAGPRDFVDETKVQRTLAQSQKVLLRQEAAFRGEGDAVLWAVSARDGKKLTEMSLSSSPVFDGLIAAGDRLYLSTMDGRVLCLK